MPDDNCYSAAKLGYPMVEYEPLVSPEPRFATISRALAQTGREILLYVCEWGIDFPAQWAPSLGQAWRIGNDIIPAWRAIFRTLNQAVPQTGFAGPGQWPDLDMLEVGNGVFTIPEEQTHFSLWAVLKSPLTIGAALRDDSTAISEASLGILRQADVVGFNQDALGVSASLRRRWTEDGYEVWSGPLSGGRTVAAVINWDGEERELSLDLPDVGLQHAGVVKDIWANSTARDVQTVYSSRVAAHGTMLLELDDRTPAGEYPSELFARTAGQETVFESVYASTSSSNYTITVMFATTSHKPCHFRVQTSASRRTFPGTVAPGQRQGSVTIPLSAGPSNQVRIAHDVPVSSIHITRPDGTYHPSTAFTLSGSAEMATCGRGCEPVGSKVRYISPNGTARATVPASGSGTKYIELDYINNDVAFSSSWGWGQNSRNITVAVNDAAPVRLEVPLSGQHSELFSAGLGWWDTGRLGMAVDGWRDGANRVVIGNEGGADGFEAFGADFVGLKLYD
jgi:alpha-galactosidase